MSEENGENTPGAGAGDGAATAAALLGGAAAAGAGGVSGAGAGGASGGDAGSADQGGTGGQDGGAGAEGGADPEFYQHLSAESEGDASSIRDWVKSKGYKSIDAIAKAYRVAERAIHDSGRVKIPGEGSSAEEQAAFRKAVGVPDDAKGYAPPPLTDGDGKPLIGSDGNPVEIDSERFSALASFAHEAGIPKTAFEAVMAKVAQDDLQRDAEAKRDIQRRAEAHAKKWGNEAAEKTAAITRAIEALGLTREEALAVRAAITPERALDLFARLGAGISEDTMVSGGGRQRFGLSGAEAQAQLAQRMADASWRDKAMVPGTPQHAEYRRLNDAIGEDADRKSRAAA